MHPHLNHDWHVAEFSYELEGLSIIDSVLQSRCEFTTVCSMSFSAFGRKDLSVFRGFVGGGQ